MSFFKISSSKFRLCERAESGARGYVVGGDDTIPTTAPSSMRYDLYYLHLGRRGTI